MVLEDGRPTGVIVLELSGEVKDWCARGVEIEFPRMRDCSKCGRKGVLVCNGKPARKRWIPGAMVCDKYHVQKLRCGRRGRSANSCGAVLTIQPSFFYPRYRYALEDVMAGLAARFCRPPQLATGSSEGQAQRPEPSAVERQILACCSGWVAVVLHQLARFTTADVRAASGHRGKSGECSHCPVWCRP